MSEDGYTLHHQDEKDRCCSIRMAAVCLAPSTATMRAINRVAGRELQRGIVAFALRQRLLNP